MTSKTIRQRLLQSTMIGGALLAFTVPAAAMLMPTSVVAQDYTSGILSGTVSDASGARVAGASVSTTSGQGTVRTTTTDANGAFRLPALAVGSYEISITSSSGSTTDRITVSPGGSSYAFTVAEAGTATNLGDIVVTGARKTQDFSRTDTGLSVDVQEFADRVPTGRSINAVTLFTPGASAPDATIAAGSRRNQSLVSLSGTSAAESVYYINGLNVTDQRSFLGYGELPFDFIQTIDTKTGGYQAEYGRATGGVVNIVTRSGTNEWTGGVSTYWTPNGLRSTRGVSYQAGGNNAAGIQNFNQYSESELKDYTAYLGGPIWKDHLFVFGVYNIRDVETSGARSRNYAYSASNPNGNPVDTRTQSYASYDDPRWAVKLDFVLNPEHRLEATIINDKTTTQTITKTYDANTDAYLRETAPVYADAGGITQIYKYTGVFTDWFTLSALYGRQENAYLDYGDPISLPGIRDYVAAGGNFITAGLHAGPYNLEGEDVRETYRVDGDFYVKLMGEHHIRVGYDKEDLTSSASSAYSGGALYYALAQGDCPAGTPAAGCVEKLTFANNGVFTAQQTALYVQDSWDVLPNLTLQLGVRNDQYDYKNVDGESYIKVDDQWAPRLGFNWDPLDDGVNRIYGSFGDYYLPIATNTSIRASSGEVYTDEYFDASRTGGATGPLVLNGNYPVLGTRRQIDYLSPPGAPDPRTVSEAGLKPMFEREFVLGYEHSFTDGMFADWSAGVRYVNRNLEQAIEDTAIGDAIVRYCVRTNTACGQTGIGDSAFASIFPYVLINPGDGASVFIDLQGDTRTLADGSPNPAYNPQQIELTADDLKLPAVERTYQALEFTFERPFDGVWGLQGSYTLSESKGNYEGAVKSDIGQTDTSITQDYDHAANSLGAYGYLPNDHRHTLKLFGSYAPNDFFSVGANFTAQSGRHYGCLGRVPVSVDPLSPQTGTPSGWYCPIGANNAVISTPRGSQGETDWTYQLDLNMNFNLLQTETKGALTASIDIFNVFDNDEVTRVVEQGLVRTSANTATARAPYYGLPRSYQSPRTVRFGLRYRF